MGLLRFNVLRFKVLRMVVNAAQVKGCGAHLLALEVPLYGATQHHGNKTAVNVSDVCGNWYRCNKQTIDARVNGGGCRGWLLQCALNAYAYPDHHTSHVTRHTSHVTRHTSHVTNHLPTLMSNSRRSLNHRTSFI